MSEEAKTPEEIADGFVFIGDYVYYDGFYIYLHDGETTGPYKNRDDAEKVAAPIVATVVQAIRDAYERAAVEVEIIHEESKPWQDRHLLRTAAARIRALKDKK